MYSANLCHSTCFIASTAAANDNKDEELCVLLVAESVFTSSTHLQGLFY